jgi:hypothetical protein
VEKGGGGWRVFSKVIKRKKKFRKRKLEKTLPYLPFFYGVSIFSL